MECRPTRHPLTVTDRSVAHPTAGTLAHVDRNAAAGWGSDGDRRPTQIPVRFADHGEKGRPADRGYGQPGPKLDAGMTLRAAGQCGKPTRGEGHLSGPCTMQLGDHSTDVGVELLGRAVQRQSNCVQDGAPVADVKPTRRCRQVTGVRVDQDASGKCE